MADKTTNYEITKPLTTENYDVLVNNANMDIIDSALAPTADPSQVPTGLTGKLSQWVSWITNRIKAITGKANWYDTPAKTIQQLADEASTHLADNTKHISVNFKRKLRMGVRV